MPGTNGDGFAGVQVESGVSEQSAGDIRKSERQRTKRVGRACGGIGASGGAVEHGEHALKKGEQLSGNSPAEKRAVIRQLASQASVARLCALFECPRSTYYYKGVVRDEDKAFELVEQVLMRQPWFGYRRVVAQLRREATPLGERVVRRILRELGHSRAVGRVQVKTTDSRHSYGRYPNLIRGMKLRQPNQVWVADITYIRLGRRFIYLVVILDAYSRAVRGFALGRSLSQELTLNALRMALAQAKPFIFHSDQGSQYAAWLHTDTLEQAHVRISMSAKGKPTQNGIA